MKLLAVLCLCMVAGAFGGVIYGPAAGTAGAKAGNQVSDVVRDVSQNAAAANLWNNAANNYGRFQNDYGNNAAKANDWRQGANSDYGQKSAAADNAFNANNAAANRAASAAASANQWASSNDANQASKDQIWTDNNAWRNGRRSSDGIDYAYDKKFDLKDSVNGGFEYGETLNSRALDDFRDRAANYDRNKDAKEARAASADSQWANQNSAWRQNAAAADANWDKFSRNANNAAAANGRDKDWGQKLDASQGGSRLWSDARRKASDVYNDLVNADWSYDRAGKNFGVKDVDAYGAGNPYAYGVAGVGGYAALPVYGPAYGADYAKAVGVKDAGNAWDNAQASKLRQGDLAASSDVTQAQYRQDSWLNDQAKGFDRNQAASANDAGASDWAKNSARDASAADARNADASSKWARDQAASNFNEDVWAKDAESKRLSERQKDNRVWGNNFANKLKGGDDWERLKYDRNSVDDTFGYDTSNKKDWASAANANAWNSAYDANRAQQDAAQAASANKNAQAADWNKAAQGWQNANAVKTDRDAAQNQGWNNGDWKNEQAALNNDVSRSNVNAWDKGAGRYGSGFGYDAGYGAAPAYGYGVAAYPAAGYGVAAYPAYGVGTLGAYGDYGYNAFPYKG